MGFGGILAEHDPSQMIVPVLVWPQVLAEDVHDCSKVGETQIPVVQRPLSHCEFELHAEQRGRGGSSVMAWATELWVEMSIK
jgi:hypothetical protein